jgi:hypothetical protein
MRSKYEKSILTPHYLRCEISGNMTVRLKENIKTERMPPKILSTCFICGGIVGEPTICKG